MIDQVAGIDYSLVGAPQVTSQFLDTSFKVRGYGERALLRAEGRQKISSASQNALPTPLLQTFACQYTCLVSAHNGQMWYSALQSKT